MDNCIHIIFSEFKYIQKKDQKKPYQFKDKAEYLYKAFSNLENLSHHKEMAISLIERAKKVSESRHALTHGTIESLSGSILTINKLKFGNDYSSEIIPFDFTNFESISGELGELVTKWTKLSTALLYQHKSCS